MTTTMTGRRRGIDKERMVKGRLQKEDWVVFRVAGSRGEADLIALRDDKPTRLIQVKSTAHVWDGFGPKERAALKNLALWAGAEAWLYWWPKWKKDPICIRADEWPER